MLIDTHCHLNFDAFDADRAEVLARAKANDVCALIIPAVDVETSAQAVALASASDEPVLFAAVGIHPNSTAAFQPDDLDAIERLAEHPHAVAIGEIGLDYHWDDSPKAQQFAAFEAQLALAARLELPVIIHNREASEDVIAILETWVATLPASMHGRAGVLHSFSAPAAIAERALAAGFYLGFTGPLTYKNADDLRHIAAHAPLDRLLVETDAPYLTPTPFRGKRNEPAFVRYVAERLASLHNRTLEDMAAITTASAVRLFQLKLFQKQIGFPDEGTIP